MFSRPLAYVLLALSCLTAAAGGAYVATRHNAADAVPRAAEAGKTGRSPVPVPVPMSQASAERPAEAPAHPVAETEAAVSSGIRPAAPVKAADAEAALPPAPRHPDPAPPKPTPAAPRTFRVAQNEPSPGRPAPLTGGTFPSQSQPEWPPAPAPTSVAPSAPEPVKPIDPQPEPPRLPQYEEVIVPASSVIGLQLETSVSSERARVEDRVEARVSRDVMAAGRVAIPAGARVIGNVIEVDKGGKVKAPARIGIRFHTLVLADGNEVSLRTEPIYREGESPSNNSARKIGGAAVAGTILGAILGGGKGAAIGGATGAAGGTAAVMSGDRTAVNLPSGQLINAKLSAPATITVERRDR